jgi:hypothetical protein
MRALCECEVVTHFVLKIGLEFTYDINVFLSNFAPLIGLEVHLLQIQICY